jgi:hypothetical protein
MSSSPIDAAILAALDDVITKLAKELVVLNPLLDEKNADLIITHNGRDIVIHAPLYFKAYIPKKYDSWNVVFVESTGNEIDIDIDSIISI